MSKLDELIQQLCPNGVEYKSLWSVTIWDKKFNSVSREKQPKVVNYPYLLAKELFLLEHTKGDVFLLSTGEQSGWTTEELAGDNLCIGEVVTIPWGKSRPVIEVMKYYKGKFVTADNRIATSIDTNILLNKYLYYWLLTKGPDIDKCYRGAGIQHPDMSSILDFEIPLPPLPVQEEIVRILDTFTESTNNLKEQIQTRRKQYEYYRNQLLTFDATRTDVERTKISDICLNICSGGTPSTSHEEYYHGNIPWLRTQEVDWKEINDTEIKITDDAIANSSAKIIPANCVIVAMYGATAAKAAINKIPLSTNQACCNLEIDSNKALYRYVYQWFCKEYDKLKAMGEGSQNNINGKKVKDYPISLPPLAEQERIVDILDQFEASITNLELQLKQREKQYEYYRNQLLDFKKKEE